MTEPQAGTRPARSAHVLVGSRGSSVSPPVLALRLISQVRLCADELLALIEWAGFEVVESGLRTCNYTLDTHSMLRPIFRSLYFVARKK